MRFLILAFVSCLAGTPAKAEFVMLSQPNGPAGSDAISSEPMAPAKPKSHPKRHRVSAPEPVLAGFGDHIPLSFAVRQIVPARYPVAFGERVDRQSVVDWKGGKPWRATLAETLKPLGLTASLTGPTVTIGAIAAPTAAH